MRNAASNQKLKDKLTTVGFWVGARVVGNFEAE
jgi:hypothetical protein